MRERAREAVTEQIGFRTEKSQFIAFDKEVNQERFTSLDKMIQSKSINTPDGRFVSSENFSMNKPNDEKLKQLQNLTVLPFGAHVNAVQGQRDFARTQTKRMTLWRISRSVRKEL